MPRKGSKVLYKPRKEYRYSVKDIAELGGMTRNALNVAKAHGKIDPADFRSVVSFLTRRIIDQRLRGDLFSSTTQVAKRSKKGKRGTRNSAKRPQKAAGRK